MFNLDDITAKNDDKSWPYRKLIIVPSGSEKTNYLLNSIQKDNNIIDKTYLYVKDLDESKYKLLIERKRPSRNKKFIRIKMLLLNTVKQWMIFMTILKITIKREKEMF